MSKLLSIIIPCYNEAATVATVLDAVRDVLLPVGWTREVIIVDDGSKDATRSRVDQWLSAQTDRSWIRTVWRDKNGGKGAALKSGFAEAQGDFVVIQDADLEYRPDDFAKLLAVVDRGEAEIVFGSRILGKNNVPFSKIYFYCGLALTKVFNLLFGTKVSDITTCYKLFPRRVIPRLLFLPSDDFVYDAIELTYALVRSGKVVEVPIGYHARSMEQGKKLNWRHGFRSLFVALKLRFNLDGLIRWLRFQKVARHVPANARMLDVGCGPEYPLLHAFRDRIAYGLGIDRKTTHTREDSIEILPCEFDEPDHPFPAEATQMDVVTLLAVLEHLYHPRETLQKIFAALKPGGVLLLTTPSTASKPILEFLAFRLHVIDGQEIADHKHYFSKSELVALLKEVGFREVQHHYFELGCNHAILAKK